MRTYTPAEVFSPGEYLRDELKERAWPDDRFAEILDLPIEETSEILDGKREVTEEIAGALSKALGTTPELWLNLQREYLRFQQRTEECKTKSLTPDAQHMPLEFPCPQGNSLPTRQEGRSAFFPAVSSHVNGKL